MNLSTKNQVIGGIISGIFILAAAIVTVTYNKQEINRGNSQFSQAIDKIEKLKELANPYNDGGSFKSYLNLLSMKNQNLDPKVQDVLLETIKKVWLRP
jgi:hypothetical protein